LPLYFTLTSPTRNCWLTCSDFAVHGNHVGQIAQGQRVVEGELLRVSISVVGFTPISGMWKTQKTLVPSEVTQSETRLLRPLMTEEMVMTVVTPMTMPRMVSPERSLFPQRVEGHLDGFALV
jgi:hypothetical protein